MWVLGKTPVAAAGISRIARSDPHGDSHDMYGITYEFADRLLWTDTGRHSNGLTGPDDPLATCEFLGSAYMKIGYGGRALIRGGPSTMREGRLTTYTPRERRGISPRSTETSRKRGCIERNGANGHRQLSDDYPRPRGLPEKRPPDDGQAAQRNRRLEVDLQGLEA